MRKAVAAKRRFECASPIKGTTTMAGTDNRPAARLSLISLVCLQSEFGIFDGVSGAKKSENQEGIYRRDPAF